MSWTKTATGYQPNVACRALDGVLGSWYMCSYSNNLLFIVVMLISLKVMQTPDYPPEASEQTAARSA